MIARAGGVAVGLVIVGLTVAVAGTPPESRYTERKEFAAARKAAGLLDCQAKTEPSRSPPASPAAGGVDAGRPVCCGAFTASPYLVAGIRASSAPVVALKASRAARTGMTPGPAQFIQNLLGRGI